MKKVILNLEGQKKQETNEDNGDFKVLIIVPRFNFTNEISYRYAFPLGFAYISAVLKKINYSVTCMNLNHIAGEINEIVLKELDNQKYDLVCMGNTYLGLIVTQKLIEAVHKHSSKPSIVVGGLIVTKEPEIMIKLLKPDYIVREEGEEIILELAACLKNKTNPNDVKGIGFFDGKGEVVLTNKRSEIENLDALPYPDFDGFGYEDWLDNQCTNDIFNGMIDVPRIYPMIGSRGCAYSCTFCYHFNSRYKSRSIDSIMAELKQNVVKYKINALNLYDDLFAANKSRIFEFCNKLIEFKKELSWDLMWGCQLAVNIIDKDVMKALKDSECCWISYGFESMSPKVLKSMNKQFITPDQIRQVYFMTKEAKINVQGNFIFGDVTETKETANVTLEEWKKNFAGQIYLTFVRPYPGSWIYDNCVNKGVIKDKMEFIRNLDILSENYYNFTENMTEEEFNEIKKKVFSYNVKYAKFTIPQLKEVKKDIYDVKCKCPYCKKNQEYHKVRIENRASFALWFCCRNCAMRFYIASMLQKIGTKIYPPLKPFIDFYNKQKITIKKQIFN